MSRFNKFLSGKTRIKVGNEELDLDVSLHDKQKIMDLRNIKVNEFIEGVKILTDLMKKSYPEESEEALQAFSEKNYLEFMQELAISFKWITRDKFNQELENLKKNVTER